VIDNEGNLNNLGRFRTMQGAKNFTYVADLRHQGKFVVSLETGDPDGVGDLNGPEPDLVLFAGDINRNNDVTRLSLIAPDLKTPSRGLFYLATPTDNSVHGRSKIKSGLPYNDDNDAQGIWFATFEQPGATPSSGLALPRIPSNNFVYEGWVIHAATDTYVSTGRFIDPSAPDWNSGQSPYDGGRVFLGPLAPGEDFVNPGIAVGQLELPFELNQGWHTTISIEPHSDTDAMPFVLRPWTWTISSDVDCLVGTVTAQPNPKEYQGQRCSVEPRYDGVAVIH